MWTAIQNNIQMVEGDFGIDLPIEVIGPTFEAFDEIRITVADDGALSATAI